MPNLRLMSSCFGSDEEGNEVLMAEGDSISDISDAGPVMGNEEIPGTSGRDFPTGWNVTCRVTPPSKLYSDLVTIDSVKLLKALEGEKV